MMGKNIKRLLFAAVLMGIFMGSGYYYFYLFIFHPQGKGPINIETQAASLKGTNSIWIVGMGDSVTAGFGATPGKSYWDRLIDNRVEEDPDLKGKCLKKIFPNLIATNLARSGSTSLQHMKNQLPFVPRDSQRKAIVIMTTGGNDLIHSYGMAAPKEGAMYGATWEQAQPWIAAFAQRLEGLHTELTARFPLGVEIFLATIYDPSDDTGVLRHTGLPRWSDSGRILAAYNSQISTLAQKHPNVHVVNVHDLFLGHGFHAAHWWEPNYHRADPYCWLADNIEDPNDRGYDAIRRLMWNAIAKQLQTNSF